MNDCPPFRLGLSSRAAPNAPARAANPIAGQPGITSRPPGRCYPRNLRTPCRAAASHCQPAPGFAAQEATHAPVRARLPRDTGAAQPHAPIRRPADPAVTTRADRPPEAPAMASLADATHGRRPRPPRPAPQSLRATAGAQPHAPVRARPRATLAHHNPMHQFAAPPTAPPPPAPAARRKHPQWPRSRTPPKAVARRRPARHRKAHAPPPQHNPMHQTARPPPTKPAQHNPMHQFPVAPSPPSRPARTISPRRGGSGSAAGLSNAWWRSLRHQNGPPGPSGASASRVASGSKTPCTISRRRHGSGPAAAPSRVRQPKPLAPEQPAKPPRRRAPATAQVAAAPHAPIRAAAPTPDDTGTRTLYLLPRQPRSPGVARNSDH